MATIKKNKNFVDKLTVLFASPDKILSKLPIEELLFPSSNGKVLLDIGHAGTNE